MSYGVFLRWGLITVTSLCVILVANNYYDIYNVMETSSFETLICAFACLGLLLVGTVRLGVASYRLCNLSKSSNIIQQVLVPLEAGYEYSDLAPKLGFLGTIAGLIKMTYVFAETNFADALSVQQASSQITDGMSTAWYTTLAGLIVLIMLRKQCHNLAQEIKTRGFKV